MLFELMIDCYRELGTKSFLAEILFLLFANSMQRSGKIKPAVVLDMIESTPHYLDNDIMCATPFVIRNIIAHRNLEMTRGQFFILS